jgi:hypothetical protein
MNNRNVWFKHNNSYRTRHPFVRLDIVVFPCRFYQHKYLQKPTKHLAERTNILKIFASCLIKSLNKT